MYSIHNEGKSVVAERFIRTLNTKIYKYWEIFKNTNFEELLRTAVSENTYIFYKTFWTY